MRPPPFWLFKPTSAYARYSEAHALAIAVIILYYSLDLDSETLFAFVSQEKEYLCWLFLVDLLYHLTATTQLAPF